MRLYFLQTSIFKQQIIGTQGHREHAQCCAKAGPVDTVEFVAEELPPEFKERHIQ